MQTPCPSLRAWTFLVAAAWLCLAFAVHAAQKPAASSHPAQTATNAAPVVPEPPKSVFIIPVTSAEGKDPFYPQSTRLRKVPVIATAKTNLAAVAAELQLKGVSGAANRRLAIINNHTFEVGEEGEVTSNSGPVRLFCKEIKDDSVRVIVNGQERTLRLRPSS
jgi:hypothetical protein